MTVSPEARALAIKILRRQQRRRLWAKLTRQLIDLLCHVAIVWLLVGGLVHEDWLQWIVALLLAIYLELRSIRGALSANVIAGGMGAMFGGMLGARIFEGSVIRDDEEPPTQEREPH